MTSHLFRSPWRRWLPAAGIVAAAALALSACSAADAESSSAGPAADEPVIFGVSAPKTGQYAYIGTYWQQGFDLALDEINADGGIDGRELQLEWHDSQSDPKQTLAIAQQFVDDEKIVAEIGDFTSGASMAASAVYERAGLVQYASASSPDFTLGGEYMFAPQISQALLAVQYADAVSRLGDKVAVLYLDTDWGNATFAAFQEAADDAGIEIVYDSSYLATTTDFRPILLQARDAEPDVVVSLGYDQDGAGIIKQKQELGITEPDFFSSGLTDVGIELAGEAADGIYYSQDWFAGDPDERIRAFVEKFTERYDVEPSNYDALAYDLVTQLAVAAREGGATREGIAEALRTTELPSVRYGPFVYQADRRPPPHAPYLLTVADGVPRIAD